MPDDQQKQIETLKGLRDHAQAQMDAIQKRLREVTDAFPNSQQGIKDRLADAEEAWRQARNLADEWLRNLQP